MSPKSKWNRFLDLMRQRLRREPASGRRRTRLHLEKLEHRFVLTDFDLGALEGRFFVQDEGFDTYRFQLLAPAVVKVGLFDIPGRDDESDLILITESEGIRFLENCDSISLPSGNYQIGVIWGIDLIFPSQDYTLEIAVDRAPGETSGSPDIAAIGREFGVLSTLQGPIQVRDFVGFMDLERGTINLCDDGLDAYLFNVPSPGNVRVTIDDVVADVAGGAVAIDFALYRDVNGNARFEPGETLEQKTIGPNELKSIERQLVSGRHALVVRHQDDIPNPGGSNYRLQLSYSVPDNAGSTLATARDIGALSNFGPVSFSDYVTMNTGSSPVPSGQDTTDLYRFSTSGDGPFVFTAALSVSNLATNFDLFLDRDVNGNGQISVNEVLATATRSAGFNEDIILNLPAPGTYFIRVRGISGEGPYSLTMSNRNLDLAGGSLATAFSLDLGTLGGYEGRNSVSDFLSATDTADVYRFRTLRSGTLQASFPATAAGTDANLQLIQDLDNDGIIDIDELLASSSTAGNASESLSRIIPAGTYFLRVSRAQGAPFYSLTVNFDTAGSTLAGARNLILDGGINDNAFEFVGPGDGTDIFSFTIGTARQVTLSFGGPLLQRASVALGRDTNGNGVLDRVEEELAFNTDGPTTHRSINLTSTGRYFVKVTPFDSVGVSYVIQLSSAPLDNADNTMAAARNVSIVTAAQFFSDFVGDGTRDFADDLEDFYRFTLADNGPFVFQGVISGVTGIVGIQLIRDDNLNQQIDSGEVLATSTGVQIPLNPPLPPVPIIGSLLIPGTYYLRVFRDTGSANYTLSLSAASTDGVGNTLATALDLGPLTSTLSAGEFVGRIDSSDVYRFSVNARSELAVSLTGAAALAAIEVIRDIDNDLVIDAGEGLGSTSGLLVANDLLNGVLLPEAGTYYVRVLSNGTDTTYGLNLVLSSQTPFQAAPFEVNDLGSTTIQVEHFDRGGEGIAYHDTTILDSGGTGLRPFERVDIAGTSDAGGGFRIIDTAVGEFLEYTFTVNPTGAYVFQLRVASNAVGAGFHVEIDGITIISMAIPNTGGNDTFTTLIAPEVLLTAGPHILRLAMDTANAGGSAGVYNFITITPAAQFTGTFSLTSPETIVAPNQHTQISLAWTVPSGSWRLLKEVDIRLRDEQGTALWVKFNESTNSLSLHNPASGKFGPAKTLGSAAVLSNGEVTIYLSTSFIQADGPTSPTVVLTLDMSFNKSLRGRRFIVEVAASDDLGHVQSFQLAGFLEVLEDASGPKSKKPRR